MQHVRVHMKHCGQSTYLLHAGENVGLAVAVTVCANTEVDLARVLVRLEGLGDTYQAC